MADGVLTGDDQVAAVGAAADDAMAERAALTVELLHWRQAAATLADFDTVAAPAAWAALESYLGLSLRASLRAVVARVTAQADRVAAMLAAAVGPADLNRVRTALLRLRHDYLRAETVVDFYGDAVNTRTNPRVAAILRGLDALAVDSMERGLRPLGIDVPPVVTYLDKGMGASILKAGARLWDASVSPAAAVKITRHNLFRPTSLVHETGHQVAHLTGWTTELAAALHAALAPCSAFAADVWRSWAGEVAADVYAFALLGYAPVPSLATVVDGSTRTVFRMPFGDPHPFAWLRVLFNAELCRSWFGPGPWDRLKAGWLARHPLDQAPAEAAAVVTTTLPRLPALVDACTRAPMRAFGGVPLSALIDPRRVAPAELARLARRAGPSLYTSHYLQRIEPMRILGWLVLCGVTTGAPDIDVESWLRRIGSDRAAAS
ncbi:hypothetical protein [Streptosporangium carneum]|uniref:Uncharacterized protein n=1 Tax=Streptosporangium carneum TaxID=47481 RepID=A0A9W6I6J1_9ACTN|nr:hypothetical protein [Streptosporangium carneum]GLK12990.1 hypothetical protein GCM10017600_64000 [Streptosporangium carneum]